jgi:hypothetical protein
MPPTYSTTSVAMGTPVPPVVTQSVQPAAGPLPASLTPTVRTLPPRIVRNQLPPKFNQVTLPAKVVTSNLPPIGPPPTPQLPMPSVPLPAPEPLPMSMTVQSVQQVPVQTVQSVAVPVQTVQSVALPYQSVAAVPTTIQSVAVPYSTGSVRPVTTYSTGSVPVPAVSSVYGTSSIGLPYRTASVGAGTPLYSTSSMPIMSAV